ncbi:hypothetical protein MRX96_045306 [Rhipicephalus microplus]
MPSHLARGTPRRWGDWIERNRAFVSLTFDLRHGDPCVDRMVQFRNVYRELKEALRKNRFIINVNVNVGNADPSKEPAIKYVLGQNTVDDLLQLVEMSFFGHQDGDMAVDLP